MNAILHISIVLIQAMLEGLACGPYSVIRMIFIH